MLDIHSHILYGVDDGPSNLETSLEMLKIAAEDGTKIIAATPHFYRGYYDNDARSILERVEELKMIAKDNDIDIEIIPGQEVYMDKRTIKEYKNGSILTLNNTKYILVETDMTNMPKETLDIIYELRILGLTPILAHPERYGYINEKPTLINDFIKEGCLFQITAGSILGLFGKKVQKTSELFIEHGLCNFIASDAHTTNRRRPGLSSSFEVIKKKYQGTEERIKQNIDYLMKNQDIKQIGNSIGIKRSIFSIFHR